MGYFREPGTRKKFVGSGSRIWATLNEITRKHYEAAAAEHRVVLRRKLATDMAEKVAALQVLTARGEGGIVEPGRVRMSSCCFSLSELQAFDAAWQSQGRCRDEADRFEASQGQAIDEPP